MVVDQRKKGEFSVARYLGPKHKVCRRFGIPLCGSQNCPVLKKTNLPGQHGRRRKLSDYGTQLLEKQKAKAIYGILERQFGQYFEKASKSKKSTGEVLLQLLETRLDNVVYRLGFAKTRSAARQLVSHVHILVNDETVNIPSYQVKPEDVVSISEKGLKIPLVGESLSLSKNGQIPNWLERRGPSGKMLRVPERAEIGEPIDERLIIEFYSR